ncbi:cytochrome ubiquinol oxidase subunit I [Methyloraptor flagellatus]|uniref:Cytochrome ubiquinol oxidase subunit I n=1 Tax=Methyloraptor flagellatus TaxID=3162530 RepID=A0AAU7XER5_9HYPH
MLENLDATVLSRIQFGFTITFHIIFPAFTIGLSAFIATLEGRWLWTGDDLYHRLARYWTKIFAISFAMGVVSGIVLSYQFGTNWSRFSVVVGNVIGPLIGYEVLTAFFLEATFLGIMLFGWNRVPPWLHFLASVMVAIGTAISAFWILSANSWMQSPAGYEMRDGVAHATDWFAVIFNPTFPYRFAHMVIAAYLTTSIVVLSVGARHLRRGRFVPESRVMLHMGLGLAAILAPLQIIIGDFHGIATRDHQPAKLAAIEGHWDNDGPAPLVLFGWPNQQAERNDYELAIPKLGSLIITHDWEGRFKGLKDFAAVDRPPVWPVFWGFRVMVGLGLAMLALAWVGVFAWWRGRLDNWRLYLDAATVAWPAGFLAIVAGWFVTEIGRQPWIATGILRTADAASPVPAHVVATSLAAFVVVYGVVFAAGIYYINRMIVKGPAPAVTAEEEGVPSRPLSGALGAAGHAAKTTGGAA